MPSLLLKVAARPDMFVCVVKISIPPAKRLPGTKTR